MIFLVIGVVLVFVGIRNIYLSVIKKIQYMNIEKGINKEYEKTIGKVICCVYSMNSDRHDDSSPVVEYEVNGETYETMNKQLHSGGELPIGTKMWLWYKKDNPRDAILGIELGNWLTIKTTGILLILIGILLIIIGI